MSKFIGQKCQSCKEELDLEAVVVVCPECGAPYHKECFSHEEKCVYEEQHGDENCFSSEAGTLDVQICGNCGKQNGRSDDVCVFCGKQLKQFREEANILKKEAAKFSSSYPSYLPDDENKGAIEAFIGSNAEYYENAFRGKYRFNFAAFFSPISFFFYRKMYAVGLLFAAGLFAIFYSFFNQVAPLYVFLVRRGFVDFSYSATLNFIFQSGNQVLIDELTRISKFFVFSLFIVLAMNFLAGFLANNIYKRHVLNGVRKCKAIYAEHFEKVLPIVGGTSFLSAVGALLVFLLLFWFILFGLF
ncbi:hypothetical protein FACS1894198_4120 [Clostridia bacterium]|nr:hypothetical protein FACS1894198_4120 [Clostridia bacterium]